jgi:hypothetical protein
MKQTLISAKTLIPLLIFSIILLAGSAFYWYKYVLTDPQRILNGMVDKSLQTTSVNRTVTQAQARNSVVQSVHLGFSPSLLAQSITNLEESNQSGKTKVTTETIGTKDADFVRYTAIDITGKNSIDTKNVLNVWGSRKSEGSGEPASFLNDALFVAVPFGNLNPSQRKQVKDEIDKTKLYNIQEAKVQFVNGRPVADYTLNLEPKALVQVLAKYVELTGVGSDTELNPDAYEGAGKVPVKLQVDVLSRHLVSSEFGGSGRSEKYTSYNASRDVKVPTESIDIKELQKRLTVIEQQR